MTSRKWPNWSGPRTSRAACSSPQIRTRTVARSRNSSTSASIASICTTSAATSSSGLTFSRNRSSRSSTEAQPARPAAIAAAIDFELRRHRNPARAPAEKAYLKSDLEFLGVELPEMRRIVRAVKQQDGELNHQELLALVRALWKTPLFDRRMMVVLLLEAFQPLLQQPDISLLERLIRQSKTWAFVDELAIAITGPLVERSPALLRVLDRWATDADFWVRRSAHAGLAPASAARSLRLSPVRGLRRSHARGPRVLHP